MVGIEIVGFVVSPAHAYEGRPGDGPVPAPTSTPDTIEVRAGHGVVGDRYAGRAAHRDAAVTVLAIEALEAVAGELGVPPVDPVAARRTILTRGLDVEALRGREFALDSGHGPVRLGGGRPAAPCSWMDVVLAPGAHAALRGRAGVRCAALGSGTLRVGPATVTVADGEVVLDASRAGVPRRAQNRSAQNRSAQNRSAQNRSAQNRSAENRTSGDAPGGPTVGSVSTPRA